MNGTKQFENSPFLSNASPVSPKFFVFVDRKTGVRRFEIKAGKDGDLPMEEAVTMLAMQCLALQQKPRDFRVMISADEGMVDGLIQKTTRLIRTCSYPKTPVPLSRRQHEVLSGVAQNLSNKEIATNLNVSERTVKFHVSALLQKYHVRGRTDLIPASADLFVREGHDPRAAKTQRLSAAERITPRLTGTGAQPRLMIPLAKRAGR